MNFKTTCAVLISLAMLALCACDGGQPDKKGAEKPAAGAASAPGDAPSSAPGSAPGSGPASAPGAGATSAPGGKGKIPPAVAADKIDGKGTDGKYHFKVTFKPAVPGLNEMFKAETLVTDAATGKPVTGLKFKLDATMPEHRHGMMTKAQHKELGEGIYQSEGMKLHMPGSWEIRADAKGDAGEDHLKLRYNQPARAKDQ